MREIRSRRFHCGKLGKTVTVIEFTRCHSGHEPVSGVESCSHQEECVLVDQCGERVFPWNRCPACNKNPRLS